MDRNAQELTPWRGFPNTMSRRYGPSSAPIARSLTPAEDQRRLLVVAYDRVRYTASASPAIWFAENGLSGGPTVH